MQEYFDVLDENGQKTGKIKLRNEVHRDGDWHAAVNVFIVNQQGEVLQQRRSPNKDSYPNMWDLSCGGHVVAGEDYLGSAVRELKEELGVEVKPADLQVIGYFKTSAQPAPGFINNSFEQVYLLRANKTLEDFKIQTEELSEIRYIDWRKLKQMLENPEPRDALRHRKQYGALFEVLEKQTN